MATSKPELGICDAARNATWETLLNADLNCRYYHCLGSRYAAYDRWARIFLAVTSSSTVAGWGLWSEYSFAWKTLSSISALLAIALPILDWSKSAAKIADVKAEWYRLKAEYEILWVEIESESISSDAAVRRLKSIKDKQAKLNASFSRLNLPHKSRLVSRCYNEVLESRGLNEIERR